MSSSRSQENCPFYPACYWAGDCDFNDWQKHDCGLPGEEQERLRAKRREESFLRQKRWRLGNRLKNEAANGKYDHLLTEELQQ